MDKNNKSQNGLIGNYGVINSALTPRKAGFSGSSPLNNCFLFFMELSVIGVKCEPPRQTAIWPLNRVLLRNGIWRKKMYD